MIHDDELPRFKEALKRIMKVRNFEELRKDILPYVREIRVSGGRKFVESMFSKKFWSIFLNKEENADMKKLWESLPFLNGRVSQKNKVKKSVVSSPQTSETEAGSENPKPEEEDDLLNTLPEQMEAGSFFKDEKVEMNDSQIHDYINQFSDNDPYHSVDAFLFDAETMGSGMALNTEEKQIHIEGKPQDNFFGDFWSAWNQRSANTDFFGLPQDSDKQVSFPAWE